MSVIVNFGNADCLEMGVSLQRTLIVRIYHVLINSRH